MHHYSNSWFNWNVINTPFFPSNSLTCLEKLDSNLYLAGTTGAGLFNFSFVIGAPFTTVFDTANNSVPDNYILDVKKDLSGIIWIGTESSGLVKWESSTHVSSNFISNSIVKTYDFFGRETLPVKNIPFLYKNENGLVEKRIIIE